MHAGRAAAASRTWAPACCLLLPLQEQKCMQGCWHVAWQLAVSGSVLSHQHRCCLAYLSLPLLTCTPRCCRPAYVGYLLCMVVFVFAAYFLYMHGKKMVR